MVQRLLFLTCLVTALTSCGGQETAKPENPPATETTTPAASVPQASAPTTSATPFSKEVAYDNIRFQVSSPGLATENSFTLTPSGLSASNEAMTEKIQGQVIDLMADDIDGDNSPEVAVIVEESPSGTRKAYVYTSFARKSFGMVYFVDVTDASKLSGYQGGDEFAFVENTFIRRFPLYEGGQKTGKTRQFQFKMKAGEAMKKLAFDKQSEY